MCNSVMRCVMNIIEILQKENQRFWDLINTDEPLFSKEDLAYWDDEELNDVEQIEDMAVF